VLRGLIDERVRAGELAGVLHPHLPGA
jgi:hypothetical protein